MRYVDYNAPIIPFGDFKWGEYALLRDWGTLAIPSEQQRLNAVRLFTELQPLRQLLNRPLIVTSGARTKQYTQYLRTRGIPAASRSAHLDWQAVDLTCPGMSTLELYNFFNKHWQGRMEHYTATPTWVHIDTRNWGKRQRFMP